MLNENIKTLRKSKGLSQEELAVRLNVVRQTVSKWEQGLSVPDSDMLIAISEALETPVSALLGENITAAPADDLRAIAEKLEVINSQLAERKKCPKKGASLAVYCPRRRHGSDHCRVCGHRRLIPRVGSHRPRNGDHCGSSSRV